MLSVPTASLSYCSLIMGAPHITTKAFLTSSGFLYFPLLLFVQHFYVNIRCLCMLYFLIKFSLQLPNIIIKNNSIGDFGFGVVSFTQYIKLGSLWCESTWFQNTVLFFFAFLLSRESWSDTLMSCCLIPFYEVWRVKMCFWINIHMPKALSK